jgi:hypothetical protein
LTGPPALRSWRLKARIIRVDRSPVTGNDMLAASYAFAAAAMTVATSYLVVRLRFYITTTTMFVGSLLLVYGPASLIFFASGGAFGCLLRPLSSEKMFPPSMFPTIAARVGGIDPVNTDIKFSLGLMYLGIVVGIELVSRALPQRASALENAVAGWSGQGIDDDARTHRLLLVAILACFAVMLFYSISENYPGTIAHFFSIERDNTARNVFRATHGGSPSYSYRVILSAIAPMLVIWGLLAGGLKKSWPLLAATALLALVTMLGKIETLSKAPPVFFLLQVMLAALLIFTNRLSWRVALFGGLTFVALVYVATKLIIIFSPHLSAIEAVYSRIFDVENETLVENFAVFPRLHPFMWGTNLRPIASLMGVPFMPSFSIVAYTWYQDYNITSPTLFIADAWADFSYAGVIVFSIVAGAICRGIDLVFLPQGKIVVNIAVLGATFWGVLTLVTTSLNIALLTGGLLLAPLLAAILVVASRHAPFPASEVLGPK